jgi:sulfate transport system substrate-binding protein
LKPTKPLSKLKKTLLAGAGATLAVAAVAAAALAPSAGAHASGVSLSLVAYSTPKDAMAQLIPAFQQTPAGAGVSFSQSYGPSGSQARAIVAGLPADVVDLSLAPDVDTLVKAGLVSPSWNKDPYRGMVTDSIVVFVVRKGNPKHIKTWADLVKPGVGIVTPNPFTSGGARWNVMAAYGAQRALHRTPAQSVAYLQKFFKNTVSQDKSAANALQTFVSGKGDVAIQYENEAIAAQRKGVPVDYVVPQQTILIENPIAVISKTSHPTQAKAFVKWLRSPTAQTIWGRNGYRPILASVARQFHFPHPKALFTIDQLGGWKAVTSKFFDPSNGIVAKIEQGLGVSTTG